MDKNDANNIRSAVAAYDSGLFDDAIETVERVLNNIKSEVKTADSYIGKLLETIEGFMAFDDEHGTAYAQGISSVIYDANNLLVEGMILDAFAKLAYAAKLVRDMTEAFIQNGETDLVDGV